MSIPSWRSVPIVSGHTVSRLLRGESAGISLDLGRHTAAVSLAAQALVLPDGLSVPLAELADAAPSPEDCVQLLPEGCRKVYVYDEDAAKYYKLFQPVEDRPPTIVINGATMHAIVGKEPWQDAADKVASVPRRAGECLDTCCGLGYSAQLLAGAGFRSVTTCEVDANVLGMAADNPWSQGLFGDPRITIANADDRDFLGECADGRFACVFHDPPTIHQAGELYGEALYREFARVLAPGGVLYHYVGAPGARVGRDYTRGVIRRMQAAGFARVRRVVSGALGEKPR